LAIGLLANLLFDPTFAQGAESTESSFLTGSWELSWVRLGETNVDRLVLTQRVDRVTGRGFGDLDLDGTFAANQLTLKFLNHEKKEVLSLSGRATDERLAGQMSMDGRQLEWTARKSPVRPPDAPTVHDFRPTHFYNHFSGAIDPVLRVFPGDTIHTETVDAGGFDKDQVQRAPGGNPLTGPFYIAGALRGDTLVLHFHRIRLNRDTAQSGSSLAPSALDPGYSTDAKAGDELEGNWHLDREQGLATLAKPSDKLRAFSVPLQPMLGCVGVAPRRRQTILSGNLGGYGGNLDYNQIKEGVTLYLPVFEPGALLFIGDGHAAQGDGELTGDALETSMEVEFTVDLIAGNRLEGPLAEDREYLMALGIANSLPEALQHSTTQLAQWLEGDFGLTRPEVSLILGFAMRYDIAEIVDPHVHLVAKVRKSALAHLARKARVTASGKPVPVE
jgi:acetamidase/formamidase